ncbi:hypothetical protein GCM10010357_21120 [Streptomyces luteireticuli]|uniref:Uncharacterized protein n=1 Tax=Streptomyces luteireticuli TaxID=173858 RepID=A0ABN0YLR1_9ACTN
MSSSAEASTSGTPGPVRQPSSIRTAGAAIRTLVPLSIPIFSSTSADASAGASPALSLNDLVRSLGRAANDPFIQPNEPVLYTVPTQRDHRILRLRPDWSRPAAKPP